MLIAGIGGNDSISANVPDGVGMIELGGSGGDVLNGTVSEDVLVDGEGGGADTLRAEAGDDALTHNGGPDLLDGGEGSDLFLSVSICDGETISGGAARANDRDNASWARLSTIGVDARIDQGRVGEIGAGDEPQCPGGNFDALSGIEDLEGSNQSDVLYGDEGANQLLGHKGEDTYHARGGNDNILANSGSRDRVIDCGPGLDQAIIAFMLSTATVIVLACKASTNDILSASKFKSGMSAAICVLGVAWMGTTFVSAHEKEIMSFSGDLLSNQPWLLAIVLVFASALLYSQAATTKALIPTALAIGVAPFAAVAAFPAVSALFILPTYPTLLAAVQMDDTGTTQIGKAVFNHPFIVPGLINIAIAVALGFVFGSFIL